MEKVDLEREYTLLLEWDSVCVVGTGSFPCFSSHRLFYLSDLECTKSKCRKLFVLECYSRERECTCSQNDIGDIVFWSR